MRSISPPGDKHSTKHKHKFICASSEKRKKVEFAHSAVSEQSNKYYWNNFPVGFPFEEKSFCLYCTPQGEIVRLHSRVRLRFMFAEPGYSELISEVRVSLFNALSSRKSTWHWQAKYQAKHLKFVDRKQTAAKPCLTYKWGHLPVNDDSWIWKVLRSGGRKKPGAAHDQDPPHSHRPHVHRAQHLQNVSPAQRTIQTRNKQLSDCDFPNRVSLDSKVVWTNVKKILPRSQFIPDW